MQRREVRTVDLRGLAGPVAVAKAASIAREMQSGETIVIVATGSRSLTDFRAWCRWTGNEVVGWSADGGAFRLSVAKRGDGDHGRRPAGRGLARSRDL